MLTAIFVYAVILVSIINNNIKVHSLQCMDEMRRTEPNIYSKNYGLIILIRNTNNARQKVKQQTLWELLLFKGKEESELLHNDISITVMFPLTICRSNTVFCFHENDLFRFVVFKCSSAILFG